MVALPSTVPAPCPICDTPVQLPLVAGPNKVAAGRLVVSLNLDTGPLKAHCVAEHRVSTGSEQATVTSQASVTVNVIRANPDDGARGKALVRRAAEQTRQYPLGIGQ